MDREDLGRELRPIVWRCVAQEERKVVARVRAKVDSERLGPDYNAGDDHGLVVDERPPRVFGGEVEECVAEAGGGAVGGQRLWGRRPRDAEREGVENAWEAQVKQQLAVVRGLDGRGPELAAG